VKTGLIIGVAAIVIGLVFIFVIIGDRNQLVAEREAINAQWGQVDNVIQRRADLIPNLVATVKGIAQQEQAVIKEVTDARAALGGAGSPQQKIDANSKLDSAISRLLVVVENYPQIKSSENFLSLQNSLEGAEDRIAQERRKYNQAIQKYNTDIELFPKNIAAGLFGFARNDAYFKTEPAARQVPKVNF